MMMIGLSANLQDTMDSRKTAVINDELRRLNMDIGTLQETVRLADSGALKEKDSFSWQVKGSDKPREHGVGFAVRNSLLRMVEPGSGGSERVLTLRLKNKLFLSGDVPDEGCRVLVEHVLCVWCGGQCWGIYAD